MQKQVFPKSQIGNHGKRLVFFGILQRELREKMRVSTIVQSEMVEIQSVINVYFSKRMLSKEDRQTFVGRISYHQVPLELLFPAFPCARTKRLKKAIAEQFTR